MVRTPKSIYWELLWTVGLFCFPAIANALFVFVHGEGSGARDQSEWHFGMMALQEVLLLGMLGHVVRLNGEGMADFTRKFARSDVALGICLAVLGVFMYWVSLSLLMRVVASSGKPQNTTIFESHISIPYVVVLLVNPFCEEFFMRGFLQTRLRQAGCNPINVVALSVAFQSAYHLYQGVIFALSLATMFALFAIYYQKTNRLWTVCVAHLILDIFSQMH